MPSVLTHYCFNKEMFDSEIEFLKDNEDIYLLGAQGPDPFFFYGILPVLKSKNAKEVRGYGTRLHKMDPSEAFSFFFDYANNSKNKDVLYSYILGAGLHYVLDRNMHPYVFYKTGFSDDKKLKKKYFVNHTLFETHLDVLLVNDKYKDYKVRAMDSIDCDSDKVSQVSDMYNALASDLVEESCIEKDSFLDSWKHMLAIEKVLYSKKGVKKNVVNLLFKNSPLNTMMHPLIVKDDNVIDYLNLKKNEWKHPASEEATYKSVYEIIEDAKEEASIWTCIVISAYKNKLDKKMLEGFTKNIIYDGYDVNSKMKVFKDVYKKGEKK